MHHGHQVGSFTRVRSGAQADQIEQERLGVFACTTATKQADQIEQERLHAPRPPSRQFYFCQARSSGRLDRVGAFRGICMHHGHQVGRLDRVGVIACTTATKQAVLLLLGAELRPIRQSRSVQGYLHAPRPPSRPIRQSRSDCMHHGHQVGSFTHVRCGAQADQIEQEQFRGICMHRRPPSRPIRQSRSDCMHHGHQVGSFTRVRCGAQADQIEQERLGVFACTTATKQADQIKQE